MIIKNSAQFKSWLNKQLGSTCEYKHYDPKSNSPRAIVSRGIWLEIVWQYKNLPTHTKGVARSFDGLNTSISYVLQLPIYFLFLPILPMIWGLGSYSRALNEFKKEYKKARGES